MKLILLTLLAFVLFPSTSHADESLAFQLACVDAGKKVEQTDPKIEKYQASLKTLSKRYKIKESEVGDATWYFVKQLRDEGVKTSALEMMQAVVALGEDRKTNLTYAETVALQTTMIQVQHREAKAKEKATPKK